MAIRIMIADDHAVFRGGLRALLENESDVEVAVEAGDGFEAVRLAITEEFDLLLLDISMPGLTGPRVAESVLEKKPHLPIVVLTMHEDVVLPGGVVQDRGAGIRAEKVHWHRASASDSVDLPR